MVDVANADAIAVLTRAPSAGGKSRLFAALGRPPDPGLLAALLLDTIDGVRLPGVRVVVAVTPAEARQEIERLLRDARGTFRLPAFARRATARSRPGRSAPADRPASTGLSGRAATRPGGGGKTDGTSIEVIAQPAGDLGERMRGTMAQLFDAGARAVAVIGSDLPSIRTAPLRAAFDRLACERDALVLGPATDGGYYLIAATRVPPVFDGIAWGSGQVLEQTRAAAARARMRVHLVDTMADVDTVDDLRRVESSTRTAEWARRRLYNL